MDAICAPCWHPCRRAGSVCARALGAAPRRNGAARAPRCHPRRPRWPCRRPGAWCRPRGHGRHRRVALPPAPPALALPVPVRLVLPPEGMDATRAPRRPPRRPRWPGRWHGARSCPHRHGRQRAARSPPAPAAPSALPLEGKQRHGQTPAGEAGQPARGGRGGEGDYLSRRPLPPVLAWIMLLTAPPARAPPGQFALGREKKDRVRPSRVPRPGPHVLRCRMKCPRWPTLNLAAHPSRGRCALFILKHLPRAPVLICDRGSPTGAAKATLRQ